MTTLAHADEMNNVDLINAILPAWERVCKNNWRSRRLMVPGAWQDWLDIKDSVDNRIYVIMLSPDDISEQDRNYLLWLASQIVAVQDTRPKRTLKSLLR